MLKVSLAGLVAALVLGCSAEVARRTGNTSGTPTPGSSTTVDSMGRPIAAGVGGTGGTGAAVPTPSSGGTQGAGVCNPDASLAPARIWRLTDDQFVNVTKEVFGATINPEVSGVSVAGAVVNLSEIAAVNATNAANYQRSAQTAAAQMVANLPALLPCASTTPNAACVEQFVRGKIARAYRRPLTDVEVQDFMALYTLGSSESPSVGVRLILEAVLQSPYFIWRTEVGTDGGTAPVGSKVALTPFEIASALSFFLRESAPDDTLWARALDGTLASSAVLSSEVDRLITTPEVQTVLGKDAALWVGLPRLEKGQKDPALFPTFTLGARDALIASGEAFLGQTLWQGTVSDLLNSNTVYLNQELAGLYGGSNVTGTGLVPTPIQGRERSAGLLTQPAVLAAHASPSEGDVVHRGLFVLRSIVCGGSIPAPPKNAAAVAASLPADATEKERAAFRAQKAECAGCHALFDPLGLVNQHYDAIGRYHETTEAGLPIDDTAVIAGLGPDLDGPIAGTLELANRLLANPRRVSDCAATNLSTIALGQDAKMDTSCALETAKASLAKNGSFPEFFKSLATSPGFATRDIR